MPEHAQQAGLVCGDQGLSAQVPRPTTARVHQFSTLSPRTTCEPRSVAHCMDFGCQAGAT
eukprot:10277248-Alexandrium_andersonii.AAC.1